MPGHSIAAVREFKSSLWATAGGKGPEINPKTILAGERQPQKWRGYDAPYTLRLADPEPVRESAADTQQPNRARRESYPVAPTSTARLDWATSLRLGAVGGENLTVCQAEYASPTYGNWFHIAHGTGRRSTWELLCQRPRGERGDA